MERWQRAEQLVRKERQVERGRRLQKELREQQERGQQERYLQQKECCPIVRCQFHNRAPLNNINHCDETHAHEVLHSSVRVIKACSQSPDNLVTLEAHLNHTINGSLQGGSSDYTERLAGYRVSETNLAYRKSHLIQTQQQMIERAQRQGQRQEQELIRQREQREQERRGLQQMLLQKQRQREQGWKEQQGSQEQQEWPQG